ncbi:MAG: hypothetical protein GXO86_04635, partial [Chlorobi bacterium]|nr:hypothetical protein [Chlorobiota bacterium]
MKKQIITFFLLALIAFSYGQIVMTNDDVAPAGTAIFLANDTLPAEEIVPGDAGADKSWNFSNVTAHTIDTIYFILPSSTPYDNEFPEANFALNFVADSSFIYTIRDENKLSMIGMAGLTEDGDTV